MAGEIGEVFALGGEVEGAVWVEEGYGGGVDAGGRGGHAGWVCWGIFSPFFWERKKVMD